MPQMNGGQALIQSIYHAGVRTVFGIPGAGQYEALDALYTEPRIRYISVRHEQATTYMADGYAQASGEIAAALVVQGAGLFNASSGIATAYANSVPMLVVTGDHHHRQKGYENEASTWLRPLTKWMARADSPSQIPSLVQEAFRHLRTGRPRPVAIEISPAVFAAIEDVELTELEPDNDPNANPQAIQQAAQILAEAKRPAIWVGGGVMRSDAAEAVQALAEYLQAPVLTSRQGKGTLPETHPLCLGMAELRFQPLQRWLDKRDVILAVGTSRDFTSFKQQVIKIDIDPLELAQADHLLNIQADARQSIEALHQAVVGTTPAQAENASNIQAEVQAIKAARFDPTKQLQPQWGFMTAIRAALPDDGILIQGMNQMGYYSRNYFAASRPHTYFTSSSHGTLGCVFPMALGAKVARPNQAVVALSGDGGFLYNAQELSTAVQYGINAVVIVFNDNAFGNVLRAQMEEFDEHIIGTRLHNPDFVKLAQSYGAHGIRVTKADELEIALREAFSLDKPSLIEVPVGVMDRVY